MIHVGDIMSNEGTQITKDFSPTCIMVSPQSTKVGSLLEWCFIISIDTCWDWFQRIYVLITAQKNL